MNCYPSACAWSFPRLIFPELYQNIRRILLTKIVPDPSSDRQRIIEVPEIVPCVDFCLSQLEGTVPVQNIVIVAAKECLINIFISLPLSPNLHRLIHCDYLVVIVRIPKHIVTVQLSSSARQNCCSSPPIGGHIPEIPKLSSKWTSFLISLHLRIKSVVRRRLKLWRNSIESRNLHNLSSHIAVHVILGEVRLDLPQPNDMLIRCPILRYVVVEHNHFLVRS